MDLRSGHAYWPIANGLLTSHPALHRDETCDVAVIGGGITGALVAHRLIERGANLVLLDARDVASGSTAASTSLLQYEIDTELVDLIGMVGEANAIRAYRLGLEAIDAIEELTTKLSDDCGFARRSSLYLASRRSHASRMEAECDCRKRAGFPVEHLKEDAIAERFSLQAPAAILSEGDAAIDAYRFTHALLTSARNQGVRIYDRTSVTSVKRDSDRFHLQTDRGPSVSARRVVFATGYESQQFLKSNAGTLHSTFAAVSEPFETLPDWMLRCHLWETARPYFYLRTTPDNRIMIGGEDLPFATIHKQDGMIERKAKRLVKRFRELFPDLDFEAAYAWAGSFGETKDGLAYIGESPEWPQAWFALGFGGNGITMSMIAAQFIADDFSGRPNPDAAIFRFGR